MEALVGLQTCFDRIHAAGGRSICVGGFVRDLVLGREPLDIDIEVQGMTYDHLVDLLSGFAQVDTRGARFGVAVCLGIEWALPRREHANGSGHRDFEVELVPDLPFKESVLRRDFTCNAIGMEARSGLLLDPLAGIDDLRRRRLHPIAAERWSEDPLRPLRAMQLLARLEFSASDRLLHCTRGMSFASLSAERIGTEWDKLLLRAQRPSIGLQFLHDSGTLPQFPEIAALRQCPQDPSWHPEGDVWNHTMMVIDAASGLRSGNAPADERLMYSALCHDLGKPLTTVEMEDGRIRSPAHEPKGEDPTRSFLSRLAKTAPLQEAVVALVRNHLAPVQFITANMPASPRAYRRLARTLDAAGTTIEELARLARADSLGRSTADALARSFPAIDLFLEKAKEFDSASAPPTDVVFGRHLIARGLTPGPDFKRILSECREIQDQEGLEDPELILDRVLSE